MLAGSWASRDFSPAVSKASVTRLVVPVRAFGSRVGPRSVGSLAVLEKLDAAANGLLDFLARDARLCRWLAQRPLRSPATRPSDLAATVVSRSEA